MNCPDCGTRATCKNSASDGESTYRVYKCPNCKRSFTTSEMLDSDDLKSDIYRLRRESTRRYQINKNKAVEI